MWEVHGCSYKFYSRVLPTSSVQLLPPERPLDHPVIGRACKRALPSDDDDNATDIGDFESAQEEFKATGGRTCLQETPMVVLPASADAREDLALCGHHGGGAELVGGSRLFLQVLHRNGR
ncbi:hypothetical protein NW762_001184 [Fusarium torreyae]|uniref:Uncharacterized protein n=1 Tax=Fusarium torreyae TaxID=1237075 RepID=A0A9W8VJN5_9HYPO|nr:hypothetical protein NW762_001184 [Fusarium torreyae]